MKDKILIFIPMYNCEKQIARVLSSLKGEILDYIDEVLVVDNRSKDNSVAVATEALKAIPSIKRTLVINDQNVNLGGSHKVAFQYCLKNGKDYCIVLHGDDQGSINDMLGILNSGEYRNYDSLLGARFAKGSRLLGYSRFRILGNRFFNSLISLLTREKIYDLGAGLNIYNLSFMKDTTYLSFDNDLTFNVFLLLYSIESKKKIKFFPLTWKEEDQVSNSNVTRQGIKTLKLIIRFYAKGESALKNEQLIQKANAHTFTTAFSSQE